MLVTDNEQQLLQSRNQILLPPPLQNSGVQAGSSVANNLDIQSSVLSSEQGSQDSGFYQETRRRLLIADEDVSEASSASTAKRQRNY